MRPGDVVAERFEVLRSAGSGGMGVVYRAHDRKTDRAVALKVLIEREEGLTDRFAEEIELLSAFDHPHIVGYVTHGFTQEGAPYLVMPWLEGQDLEARLRAGPLSIDETLTVALCVADALACLHGRGLVHRDLKPSNLFLPDGRIDQVQVIDLGIARTTIPTRPLTMSGILMGTPGFIAPEQARGDREIAPTVDVFAFGCVLFECLTGKRLFGGSHVMAVLAKILLEEPPRARELRPDVPDGLDLLIHKMVSKDPARRPRDGAQLKQWLEEMRDAPPGSTRSLAAASLTANEQRVVTVVVAVLPSSRGAASPTADVTRTNADPFRASSARFGVRVHPLAEGIAIALAPEGYSAVDQASLLARFGHHVTEVFPGACVALATGSAVTGVRLPVGEAIDRGVTMVRAAAPGRGVHLDDVSARLITSRFDVRREEGRLFLEDERLSLDPTRPLLGKPTSCVGRDGEFAMLEASFAECADGGGPKVFLVTASAGAGKSRLRHEFVRRLRASSAVPPRVLQCHGDPLHLTTPYAQIAQAVRQAADLREREPPGVVREKLEAHLQGLVAPGDVDRVTDFLGEMVGASFDDDGHLRLRAARQNAEAMADQVRLAFEDVLRAWCRKQPVVLVLEDLHWGDAATVKLLDGALRKLEGEPILVLAMARPEVHERFPGLWKNRHVTEIRLPPLAQRACMKLVREIMGENAIAEDVRRIVERSEGNAFYLEELIRAAAERGPERASRPPTPRADELPETVIAVAQARLERLDPAVRKVLRAASIFGDVFWLEGVCALVGERPSALGRSFDALVEHEAIAPSEQPRFAGVREFAFRHALLRGAAYATLTDGDRALGHRLAAQWLERVDEDREVVAIHWLEGGERRRAAVAFAAAGESRWARAQAEAAARCAVRSLLLGDLPAEGAEAISDRVRLLDDAIETTRRIDARDVMTGLDRHVALPDNARGSGNLYTVVHVALDRAIDALRGQDDPAVLSTVLARGGCALAALSDFKEARRLLTEATTLAGDDGPRLWNAHYASAKAAFWAGEYGSVIELLSSAVLPSDPRERVDMLLFLATATVAVDGRDALHRGLAHIGRAEALLDAGDADPLAQVHCAKARVTCFYFAGEHEKAAEAAEAAVALSRRAGLRYEECIHLHNIGELTLRQGELERARAALVASTEIARDIGAERIHLHNEALIAFLDGREARLEELAEGFRAVGNSFHELHARYWLGHLLAERGEANARRELASARDLARELQVRTMADDCTRLMERLPADG